MQVDTSPSRAGTTPTTDVTRAVTATSIERRREKRPSASILSFAHGRARSRAGSSPLALLLNVGFRPTIQYIGTPGRELIRRSASG
jgi:hypothetical protein